jgi:hypothetical protein
VSLGLDTVRERLGGYIRLSIDERREAAKNLASDGYSTGEVAEILGVNRETIRLDAKNLAPLDAVATLAADEKVARLLTLRPINQCTRRMHCSGPRRAADGM